MVYEDEEAIDAKINVCPLLLFDEEESGVYRLLVTVRSFSKVKDLDSLILVTKIVPHVAKMIADIENLLFK